jgi:hypothetical protein
MDVQPDRWICALPFVIVVVPWLGRGPIFSLPTASYVLGAIVAARLGGWLAGRDHGVRATAFTFVIYIFLCATLKVEYLQVDLGNGVFTSPPGGTFNSRYVRLTNDIFRIGMNWKFNPWDPTMLNSMY